MPLQNLIKVVAPVVPESVSTAADAELYGDLRDPWDIVILGDWKLPGIADVGGHGIEHQIDVKKSPGKDGATITDLGRELAKIEIKLQMWTKGQWAEFSRQSMALQVKDPKGGLTPIDVRHPAINAIGVRSLVVNRIRTPQVGRHQPGVIVVELECTEFRPPATGNVTNTPKASRSVESHLTGNFQTADGRTVTVDPSGRPIRPSQDPSMIGPGK